MTAFELFGVLKLDKSEFEKGLNNAEKNASSFGSKLGNGLATAAGIGLKAVGAATAAVTGFGATAVAVGSSFDAAMGGVAATAGKSVDELSAELGEVDTAYGHFSGTLRDFALYMGQNTTFSATEAANALNYMALAGYNTQQSMEMLPSVLSMAAAGSMDLAKASDMITDTQSALGLSFERTGDMVNEFAKAASTGNTSVEQLGEAMLRVGGLGAELNGGFITLADGTQAEVDNVQELEIAFTAMANAGIKGSEAGTHMRNMLLKLASPTDDGAAAFEALGVSIFDSEGKMRSLGAIMEDLGTGLNSLTQADKLQAISDIFNTRDTAAAEALMNAMGQDWDRIGEAILQADGAADEMSKTKLDNLTGDMTLFKSALETAQITINDQLSPTLRQFVQLGTTGLQEVTSAFNEGGLEGAMGAFGSVLSDGLKMVVDLLPTAINAGAQLLGALGQGIIDNLPQIVDAAVQIAVQFSQGLVKALPELAKGAVTLVKSLSESLSQNSGTLMEVGSQLLSLLWDGITEGLPMLAQGAIELMGNLAEYLQTAIPELLPVALNALMEFSGSLRENAGLLVDGALNLIKTLAQGLIDNLPVMIQTIPTIVSNIAGIINDNAPKLIATGIELIGDLLIGIVEAIPTIIAEFPKIIKAIFDVIMAVNWIQLGGSIITGIANGIKSLASNIPSTMQNIGVKAVEFFRGIPWNNLGQWTINMIKTGISGLLNVIPNLLKTIGLKAVTLFKSINWLDLGVKLVVGIVSGIGNAAHLFYDAIANLAKKAWEGITSFFKIESPSKRMMWAGEMIDAGLAKGITDNMGNVESAYDDLMSYTNSLDSNIGVSSVDNMSYNSNSKIIALLEQIAAGGRVEVVLQEDADAMFRVMQRKSRTNKEITGQESFA